MRYLPHTTDDVRAMLERIGVSSIDELFASIPANLRLQQTPDIPDALSEQEIISDMLALSNRNQGAMMLSFAGGGIYNHYAPIAVDHILKRSEFYTAYTPYQPEIAQGTLQTIFEYQSLMTLLLGMDVSNASMYDGATATAEACLMARRLQKKRDKVLVCRSVNPEFRKVTKTYLSTDEGVYNEFGFGKDGRIDLADLDTKLTDDMAAVVVGYPNYFGAVEDLQAIAELVHQKGALLIATFGEPLAFGLLTPPGELGADIVVGEGQSFLGQPNFGGPSLGIFCARMKDVRQMPGRLCGQTVDKDGKRSFVLTLSTREQHIRRAKATSNICTNQGLMVLAATIYLELMGKAGVRRVAEINVAKTQYLKDKLAALPGFRVRFDTPVFNEFVLESDEHSASFLYDELLKKNIIPGIRLDKDYPEMPNAILVNTTELHSKKVMDSLVDALSALKGGQA